MYIWKFEVESHDYFEHFGARLTPDVITAPSLAEAYRLWKESRAKDFYWPGDHERITHDLHKEWVADAVERQPKHGMVFGHKPTRTEKAVFERRAYCGYGDVNYWLQARVDDAYSLDLGLRVEVPTVVHGWDGEIIARRKMVERGAEMRFYCRRDDLVATKEADGKYHLRPSGKTTLKVVTSAIANAIDKINEVDDLVDFDFS